MTKRRLTVHDLLAGKGSVQRTNVFVTTPEEAAAAEAAGVDMLTVDGRLLTSDIRSAAPRTFLIGGLAFGHLATTDEYLRSACDSMSSAPTPSTTRRA
jgi:3-methyl-2-oxobutanoate hydroxymethyltransferase